jgi:hypothetical protein
MHGTPHVDPLIRRTEGKTPQKAEKSRQIIFGVLTGNVGHVPVSIAPLSSSDNCKFTPAFKLVL